MFTFHFLLVLLRQLYKFATNMGEGPLFCRIEGEEELRVLCKQSAPTGRARS